MRAPSNVAIFKVVTIGGDEGWSGKKKKKDNNKKNNDKKTMTKKTKKKKTKTKKTMTKTLILRRRVELRGRGVSRECRRPAQASVQAAVCRASQRVLTEWREESPSKGRAASPGQCPQFHRDNDNDKDIRQ